MQFDDILKSTFYFNFVDKINSLANELLYGENGYYFLKSYEDIERGLKGLLVFLEGNV